MNPKISIPSRLCFLISLSACSDGVGGLVDEPTVLDIEFNNITSTAPDSIKTLESLKREGDLFVLTYYGDYSDRLEELNDSIVEHGISSVIPAGAYGHECSMFSGLGDPELPVLGRNLDNNDARAVLVGLYTPSDAYASVTVSNMYDMGFGRYDDPTLLPISDRLRLLNSALFVTDGINECGVSIALASVDAETIRRDANKKLVTISYIMREVLDHAGDLNEAIAIVRNHDVFDQNVNTISHHLLIADAAGHSAVTEYVEGEWKTIRNDRPWQVATNTRLYNMSRDWVRDECDRYRVADDYLDDAGGTVTWQEGMSVLSLMSVSETQWSTVYDMTNRDAYLCLYRGCESVFRIGL
jgi:choloylglycine hydrolase